MRELTTSCCSSFSALCFFSAQQMNEIARRDGQRSCARIASSLDSVTDAARSTLSDRLRNLFTTGDDSQRGFVDLLINTARLNLPGIAKSGTDVVNPVVQGVAWVAQQQNWLTDWQELRNKIDIFDLVRNVETRVDVNEQDSLSALVDRAYQLGDFHALWAVEGLGHYYANQSLRVTDSPAHLLTDPRSIGIPDKSLPMLNAGLGLAFAETLLGEIDETSTDEEVGYVIQRFLTLCSENTTPGYNGAAIESLGLVARAFHASLVAPIDRCITPGNEELSGYFWHGVGRAVYFSREYFIPSPCSNIPWETIATLAPHKTGRANIIAGLAWAVTLVNMKTPQVMERLLRRQGDQILSQEGFGNGVCSSIAIRRLTSPGAPFVSGFNEHLSHVSGIANGFKNGLWNELTGHACETTDAPHFIRSPEQAFRFQSLQSHNADVCAEGQSSR